MVKKLSGSFIAALVITIAVLGIAFVSAQDIPVDMLSDSGEVPPGEAHMMPDMGPGGYSQTEEPSFLLKKPGAPTEITESAQTDTTAAGLEDEDDYLVSVADQTIEADKNEKISLDLRSINVEELFKILSVKTKKSILLSPSVRGRISLYLNNITFEDALEVVLVSNRWAAEKQGDVILVTTEAEYKALYGRPYNEKKKTRTFQLKYASPSAVYKALEGIKSSVGRIIVDAASGTVILIDTPEAIENMYVVAMRIDTPLMTKAFEVQYADAEELKPKLESLITPDVGKVVIDKRSNSIVVTDLPGKMASIMQAVKLFDDETKGVFIEAEILELELRDRFQYGFEWEKFLKDPSIYGMKLTSYFPVTLTKYQNIVFGNLETDKFTATINMLNTIGKTRILSRPRLAVVNNEEASIMVGRREVYSTQAISQGESTTVTSESIEFIDVGVKLNVTPTINSDGFITMRVRPEVSSVVDWYETAGLSSIPIVQTSESSTTVKIKDGEMIMIAGLMQNLKARTTDGIPLLCKIPFIGGLFGDTDSDAHRKEIIVFITPHIMHGDKQRSWDKEEVRKYPEDLTPESKIEKPEVRQWKLKGLKP